jgi:hypothetical protein
VTGPGGDAIAWYICTCGVQPDAGFEWYPVTPGADPAEAEADVRLPMAACVPGDITDDSRQSLLLGRRGDGWALYVGGLRPRHLPEGLYRPIRVTLLGLAPAGADPRPLLDVAGLALLDRLADELPVDWPDKRPVITDGPWPPLPAPRQDGADHGAAGAPDLGRGVGYPDTDRRRAWADLERLSGEELAALPAGRLLFLRSEVVGPQRLGALRPWRACSNRLSRRTEWTVDADPVDADPREVDRRARHGYPRGTESGRTRPAGGARGPIDTAGNTGDSGTAGDPSAARRRSTPRDGEAGDGRVDQAGDSERGGERRTLGRGALVTIGVVLGAALASAVWLAIYYFAIKGYRIR